MEWEIDQYEIWIIYFAGVIRGAIAFGLVLSLREGKNVTLIKSNTMLLVLLTTIVLGGMMSFII